MNGETNGKRFDWRPILVSGAIVLGGWAVQWGITSATLAEHTRRIELLEKRMEERSVAREEYERRHIELQDQVKEQEKRLRELERKVR